MGRFDKLKETFNKTAENVKNTGKQVSQSLKDVDLKSIADTAKSKTEEVAESAKNVNLDNVKDSFNEMGKNLSKKLSVFKKNSEKTDKAADKALKVSRRNTISVSEALKIMYLLMACDSTISIEESEKFDLIANDLLGDDVEEKNSIVEWCKEIINSVDLEEDYYDTIRDGISRAMKETITVNGKVIDNKILLWNMVVIAYTDTEYSSEEGKIIRFVARSLGVDKAFIPEMESSIQAISAIEKEEQFLKNSNRKYSQIEAELNELADRKTTIRKGIEALILD